MRSQLLILSLASLFNACLTGNCITQSGTLGKCINIRQCTGVMRLLKGHPPRRVYENLQKEQCGFDENELMICCELPQNIWEALSSQSTSPSVPPSPTTKPSESPKSLLDHPNFRLLDHDLCGTIKPEPRIYGGSETRLFEFPWMALLGYDFGKGTIEFRCGGTIINHRYILTAAHCVSHLPVTLKFVSARVGEYNISSEWDCENYDSGGTAYFCSGMHQDFDVEQVLVHPNYSTITLQNDIALVRVNGKIDMRPLSVRPICLPLNSMSQPMSSSVIVTGWGATENGSLISEVLLKLELPLLPLEACKRANFDQPYLILWHKQLCAGGLTKKDSCTGDSGGPLQSISMYQGKLRFVQHGIVSYGSRVCAQLNTPGVYTNVAYYVDWILDSLED